MKRALKLAEQGLGKTSPNPMVGAVIVKNNKIIGEGYHQKSGEPHAEPLAIQDAISKGANLDGAELFCTLEPCCHKEKKTPPCTQEILKYQFKSIICASLDPNPKVAGKGLIELKNAGIETESGILEEKEKELNKVFRTNMIHNRPFIHLKVAQSLDGKINDYKNNSQWITSEESRKYGHFLRGIYDGIIVSSGTVISDNPSLNVRYGMEKKFSSPRPIIIGRDSVELRAKDIFKSSPLFFDSSDSLKLILKKIYKEKITSLLIEGGPRIISRFIDENLFDELSVFIAPKILGGGISSFEGIKKEVFDQANIAFKSMEQIGEDIHLRFISK